MEVKKAIKKVVAFGAGATMVGATVLSAMAAADLSAYPAPFVKDGAFDALIVVGEKAASKDVVGAVDIGASLQYAMKTTKKVTACSGATPTVQNGISVAKTGNYLNYDEILYDVRDTAVGADELPTVLADGKYVESKGNNNNDVTYTQKLYLINNSNSGKFFFTGEHSTNPYPSGKDAAEYIYFGRATTDLVYRYMLEFDSNVLFDNSSAANAVADLKNTQVEIQGQKYTVTDVKAGKAGNTLSEMTLMAGDTLIWLTQDQKITKTVDGVNHEVQVVDVTETADSCGVSVDGDVSWVDKGTSETINGVKIGVTDAKVIHAQLQDQDICQINIGSTELKIRGSDGKIKQNGKELDNAYGYFMQTAGASSSANAWKGLNITFYPSDKVYMAIGDKYSDPVFQRWQFMFAGLGNNDYEKMTGTASSSQAEFKFTNYEGKEVSVPFFMNDSSTPANAGIFAGEAQDRPLVFPGETYVAANDIVGSTLYVVTSGHVVHVLSIDSVDVTNKKVSLKDVTYDKSYTEKVYTESTDSAIDLGSVGTVTLNIAPNAKNVTYVSGPAAAGTAYSKNEAIVNVTNGARNTSNGVMLTLPSVEITEKDDGDSTGRQGVISLDIQSVSDGGSGNKTIIATPTVSGSQLDPWADVKSGSTDDKVAVTKHGSKITFDSKDKASVEVLHPKKDIIANVFIAPVSADVLAASGDVETTTISQINVGAARLDSEVADVTKDNMIVVGGPCANDVALKLTGVDAANCAKDFTEGKALVKLYEQSNGKVAMLVAGFSADDTRRATTVVADYSKYKSSFKGTEVVVSGQDLTNIEVKAPQ